MLGYMPNFAYTDADNTLKFVQRGDMNQMQQIHEVLVRRKTVVDAETGYEKEVILLQEPIPTQRLIAAKNGIMMTDDLLGKNRLTAWVITIIAFLIMVVAQIIFLYITRKR
jgi:hypothetical protein